MNDLGDDNTAPPKQDRYRFFDTAHLTSDLKGRSVRGGAVTFASQFIRFLLQTGSTIVLARLLTPTDFGLIAMVTAVTRFVELIKDVGLSIATIQKDDIDHSQVSTLFWINVAVTFSLAMILVAGAHTIARFYNEARLSWITITLAGTFVISGLSVQHEALLSRQMRFSVLATIELISFAIGIITAVALALYGAAYWALVYQSVATTFLYMVLVWSVCRWRPGMPHRGVGVRSLLAFGGQLTGFNILNYFVRNLDHILIGKYWGANPLAYYSKAYGLLKLPLNQLNGPMARVAIPVLSRLQDDHVRYRRFYLNAIRLLAYLTMPLVAFMGVLSRELVTLILGAQWIEASSIFMVLAFSAFLQPISNTTGWVFVSLNRTRDMALWGLISCPVTCLAFVIGLQWGPIGVAISYTIIGYVMMYFLYTLCFRSSPVEIGDIIAVLVRPFLLSLAVIGAIVMTRLYLTHLNAIWIVLGCSIAVGITYILSWLVVNSVRADFNEMLALARSSLGKAHA